MSISHVIKRSGSTEAYDHNKLYRSVVAACLSVRTPEGSAEITANNVCLKTEAWLAKKPEVTSADIRRKASETLGTFDPDAAYIYQKHRSTL